MALIGEVDVDAIASTISVTAVDIFIYDTRKDSDGGAWRKRTQNTSWYNETLNTATRGSRKDFPQVAVIVAHGNDITIYDGDDPDLPMWMKFEGDNFFIAEQNISSVFALNGRIVTGSNGFDAYAADFLYDAGFEYGPNNIIRYGNIAIRNNAGYTQAITTSNLGIVNRKVNDVAMTVLPNAPIDDVTGLPIPTIAFATNGGVSVIVNSEDVYNLTPGGGVEMNSVSFDSAHNLVIGRNNFVLLRSDYSTQHYFSNQTDSGYTVNNRKISIPSVGEDKTGNTSLSNVVGISNDLIAYDTQELGLGLYSVDLDTNTNSMVANITSSHNTGWMQGDIKLATLSDTDDTNLTDTNLVINGTFDSTSNWALTGAGAFSISSGTLNGDGTSGDSFAQQAVSPAVIEANKTYTVKITVTHTSGSLYVRIANGSYSSNIGSTATHTVSVKAGTTTTETILIYGNNWSGTIDNVEVTLEEQDRTVNDNGLQVFGTVTKSAVATGADLVAYSGFSSSNYLQQPHNADLEFGTNDWAFCGWYKGGNSGATSTIFEIGNSTVAGTHIGVRYDTSPNLELFISDDSFASQDVAEYAQTPSNFWQFFCAIRRGGVIELWNNGQLKASTTIANAAGALVDSTAYLRIGNRTYVDQPLGGSVALFRISATVPSEEQIKKMYNDEKFLFQENAQATLYGTSDAVTALAFDDDTNLLHVGTSAGRSVFQGLKRVENTTDAVGSAISASNGMVADE